MGELGISGFIERDEVSVGIKDCEFTTSPRCFGKRGVRVNYSVTHTLSEQEFNSLDADSATAGFSYSPITARPKVNAYDAAGHNPIRSLLRMNLYETKLGTKEFDTPLDVQRRKDWRCDDELYGLRHALCTRSLCRLTSELCRAATVAGKKCALPGVGTSDLLGGNFD